ncbi:TatD family hydrolase [Niallia endozanthoxylica]|uniref:TatD family deoxyribonuclease n=1 Tax=Niallia endozanthoxylica TaxID=2036016 RepID=A0A5J5HQ86_9BACI|nr:TatD family hydrolase [Niallia endozanthoxylica]KAA9021659.1 TatD family deoxyribonuclease [Niallia endozanthoxylica]
MRKIIDAHIHLDHYPSHDIEQVVNGDSTVDALIGVSYNLASCIQNQAFSQKFKKFKSAFGWHPEQTLISGNDFSQLIDWIKVSNQDMIAIGEVGLPYYSRQKTKIPIEGYIERLETFIHLANKWKKPIVLHAVYDDAPIVCNLLEKYDIKKAHFHWFKGDLQTISRLIDNNYFISITPDIVYEKEIQELVRLYPIEKMMVETDGPWPFEGPFQGRITHPNMIHTSINMIAEIKQLPSVDVYRQLYKNTTSFYHL